MLKFFKSFVGVASQDHADPQSISDEEAKQFFAKLSDENQLFVRAIYPWIDGAKTIFDVGANAGYFSKAILDSGFQGNIVLFEPIKNLHEISKKNLAPFAAQTTFLNTALGDEDGELNLYLPHDGNIGWITAIPEKAKSSRKVVAKVSASGPIIENYRPEFLKIDVEGFEAFILEPLCRAISSEYRPAIFVELGWGVKNPSWRRTVDCLRTLEAHDYGAYDPRNQNAEILFDDLVAITETKDVLLRVRD